MLARINGQGCIIEVEGDNTMELMRNVSAVQEIFAKRSCGLCGEAENLRFNVRHVVGFDF